MDVFYCIDNEAIVAVAEIVCPQINANDVRFEVEIIERGCII